MKNDFEKMVKFPNDFVFGVATSAYQIEGGWNEGGRTTSVWDDMCHGAFKDFIGGSGDIACDFYHKWKEDIDLMASLSIKAYRFSLSWSRILPHENGKINQEGIEFYNNLIDYMIKKGITPYVTLYHFDLPTYLQNKGGWLNKQTISDFEIYAKVCFEAFGDRVKNWMTINEPYIVANMYTQGLKYQPDAFPGMRAIDIGLIASHNLNLAHSVVSKAYNECKYSDGLIGIVPNLSPIYGDMESNKKNLADCIYNRFYMEYAFKGDYPKEIYEFIKENEIKLVISEEDKKIFSEGRTDFIGVNHYSRMILKPDMDFINFTSETMALTDAQSKEDGVEYSDYGWEIYPKGMYEILMHLTKLYDAPKLIVTENGCACKDDVLDENGVVIDEQRIKYLASYMEEAKKAIDDGANLIGYFIWTFMDNFEWTHGFKIKMGLIKVDFENLKRTMKKSAFWFKNMIKYNEQEKK